MIEWISNWSQGIIIAVIIGTIVEMLIPNGNYKKYIKVVIGCYILFTIIFPIVNNSYSKNFDINEIFDTSKYDEKLNMNNKNTTSNFEQNNSKTIKDIYQENIQNDLKSKMTNRGYDVLYNNIEIENYNNKYEISKITLRIRKIKEDSDIKSENKNNTSVINEIKIDLESSNDKVNNIDNQKEDSKITKEDKYSISRGEIENIKTYISESYNISRNKISIN